MNQELSKIECRLACQAAVSNFPIVNANVEILTKCYNHETQPTQIKQFAKGLL